MDARRRRRRGADAPDKSADSRLDAALRMAAEMARNRPETAGNGPEKGKRGRRRAPGPDPAELRRLYQADGESTKALAERFGISGGKVRRELRAIGVELRSNAKRSRLRTLDQAALFSDIVLYGVEEAARRQGISERALQRYLAGLRGAAREK